MTTEADLLAKQVKGLSILAKERVASFLTGNRRSLFRGQGTDFADLREYVIGDDSKYVDWRATAKRNGNLIVKEYDVERNTNIILLLDVSASMLIGKKRPRIMIAIEAVASLAHATTQNKDFIGFGAFSDEVSIYIPPKGGVHHEFYIYRQLLNIIPQGTTNIGDALKEVSTSLKQKSLILVISDLHDNLESTLYGFKIARAFKHEVQLLQISDYGEYVLPEKLGKIKFQDPETGKPQVIDFTNTITKGLYSYELNKKLEEVNEFKRKLRGLRVRVIESRTEDLVDRVLNTYYSSKSRSYNI